MTTSKKKMNAGSSPEARAKAAATRAAQDERIAAKVKAGRSSDIPLKNIPERPAAYKAYTEDFKRAAAQRVIDGEALAEVARDLAIPSATTLAKWVRLVQEGLPFVSRGGDRNSAGWQASKTGDASAAILRQSLQRAVAARDERLEAAACIVEADCNGSEAEAIAKKIRAMKRAEK